MVKKIKAAAAAIDGLSVLDKVLIRFFDMCEKKEYFHFHNLISDDSIDIELLYGLIKFRYGKQQQVTVFCSPRAFAVIKKATLKLTAK